MAATPKGWSPTATATGLAARARERQVWLEATIPCPTCWERGHLFEPLLTGQADLGLVPVTCPGCNGDRRVPRDPH